VAAYNLLVQLAKDCPQNLAVIVQSLVRMHHFYDEALAKEFAYEPLVERRAGCNYVGLKNAGATCYMNSVLQQLYTVPGVCKAVLNNFDDLYEDGDVGKDGAEDETVFYQLQNVFGHLLESKLQHYIPEKFWHTFRLFGQPVNVREQQDAFEFFTQIVDQVDEFLTSKKRPKLFSEHFEGVFSDQMLCQGCPHRYEREQSFMALNLTVKSNSLQESLDQFVRGELLEGDNAYLCEKCQEKRSTTKRMCIRKLPKTLVIQLKRFHYDWETNRAVKFDEYFEFPWSLDMGPYTTEGIQKAEKAAAAAQTTNNSDDDGKPSEKRASIASPPPPVFATSANRKLSFSKAFAKEVHSYPYDLVGVVVHSGQANAGHYYSFIRDRNSRNKWLKFNDTTVEEFEMTEETMKQECFGGSFKVKKPSASSSLPENRQRYWNAYMLFYECRRTSEMRQAEKKSHAQSASMVLGTPHSGSRKTSTPAAAPRESLSQLSDLLEKGEKTGLFNKVGGRMPSRIERGIQEENLRFLQNRDVYCEDYYRFVYDLASANRNPSKANRTPLAIESVKLAVNFFLNSYCHVKRRQKAMLGDIIDTIDDCLESSAPATQWLLGFLANVDGLRYFRPFLLECSAREVRVNFYHLVEKALAYFHRHNNCNTDTEDVNRLLATMAGLVKDDVANHIKTCGQFFSLLNKFASLGVAQCQQLFQLKVFNATVKLLLGIIPAEVDGDNKSNRQRRWAPSQCRELGELHMTLSCLILACDTTPFRAVGGGNIIIIILSTCVSLIFMFAVIRCR
jgi:ubiquitin carboxyl-terminal hydrolase 9/24